METSQKKCIFIFPFRTFWIKSALTSFHIILQNLNYIKSNYLKNLQYLFWWLPQKQRCKEKQVLKKLYWDILKCQQLHLILEWYSKNKKTPGQYIKKYFLKKKRKNIVHNQLCNLIFESKHLDTSYFHTDM